MKAQIFWFLNLTPAFDGVRGWITVIEADLLDPRAERFSAFKEWTAADGTIFLYLEPVAVITTHN